MTRTSAQLLAAWIIVLGLSISANAATFGLDNIVTNFTFDSETLGQPLQTTAPGTDPIPQDTVYATGGFPDTPPYSGSSIVANVAPLTKAALMTTTQGGIGANWVDTQFLQSVNDRARISFDLNIVDVPTTGIPQATATAPGGQAWVMQVFSLAASPARVVRFIASPTSATGGNFGLRNNTDGNMHIIGTYTEGQTNHIDLVMDFNTSTTVPFINDVQAHAGVTFVDGPAVGLSEMFIFQNGVEGISNQVAFDNLVLAVPEPASLAVLPLIALLGRRRRSVK